MWLFKHLSFEEHQVFLKVIWAPYHFSWKPTNGKHEYFHIKAREQELTWGRVTCSRLYMKWIDGRIDDLGWQVQWPSELKRCFTWEGHWEKRVHSDILNGAYTKFYFIFLHNIPKYGKKLPRDFKTT